MSNTLTNSKISFVPPYQQIERDMKRRIEEGEWSTGMMIPSRRALAQEYNVELATIQRAMSGLLKTGILRADGGRGTFVAWKAAPDAPQLRPKSNKSTGLGRVIIVTAFRSDERDQMDLLQGLESSISAEKGLSVVRSMADDGTSLNDADLRAYSEGFDGIVLVPGYWEEHQGKIHDIGYAGIPIVVVVTDELDSPLPYIYHDHRDAGRQAAQHLMSQGCRSLLAFAPYTAPWAERRVEGARDRAGNSLNRAVSNEIMTTDMKQVGPAAYEYAKVVIGSGLKFDGVIGLSDVYALAFRTAAAEAGLTTGVDFALIGFDDTVEARRYGLTSIRPPMTRCGEEAIRLLSRLIAENRLAGNVPEPTRICLHSNLVVRESSQLRRQSVAA